MRSGRHTGSSVTRSRSRAGRVSVGLVVLSRESLGEEAVHLGGATPLQAAAVQLVVLVALLLVAVVATAITLELSARGTFAGATQP